MTHPRSKTWRQSRALVLLFVVLSLGMRVLYTPIHLALEEHLGPGQQPVSHATEGARHAHDDHEHDGDHEHDDDHLPHPALDHAYDLIAQRAYQQGSLDLSALSLEESWSLRAFAQSFATTVPELRPPKPGPRSAPRPRGPPAAA